MSQRPANFTINPAHPLANGLVFAGLGAMPGSTLYRDSSLFGRNGTLTGYTGAGNLPSDRWVWNSTINRTVLNFNGTSDYVAMKPVLCSNTSWTAATWCVNIVAGLYQWIARGSITASFGARNGSGAIVSDDSGYYYCGSTSWAGTFHHAVTYNSPVFTSYKNGVLDGTKSGSGITATWSVPLKINYGNWGYTNGSTTDMMIWSRVLSPAEIAVLANPNDPMLGGLVQYPRRRAWYGYTPATAATLLLSRRRKMSA